MSNGQSRFDVLVANMCQELVRAVMYSKQYDHRQRAVPPAYFGRWFYSPLARNSYAYMCEPDYSDRKMLEVKPATDSFDSKAGLLQAVEREQQQRQQQQKQAVDADEEGKPRTIKRMDMTEINERNKTVSTLISVVTGSDNEKHTSLTTTAYDGRSAIGVDSLSKVYGQQQKSSVRDLQLTMAAQFARQHHGAVDDIMQTLLVLALEPVQFSMHIELHRNFDEALVVDNLMEIAGRVSSGVHRPIVVQDNDDDELDSTDREDSYVTRLIEFRQQFSSMRINLFSRFPELAIECNDSSPLPLLRAISSFWVLCKELFDDCELAPQSEHARHFKPRCTAIMEGVLGTRADLIYAVVCANIEGIGRTDTVRDLFLAALLRAHHHVDALIKRRSTRRFLYARQALAHVHKLLSAATNDKHRHTVVDD